jgi:NAD(P)-dependent dehydrogenase (short-subunit alcohol dehydrogenase family)
MSDSFTPSHGAAGTIGHMNASTSLADRTIMVTGATGRLGHAVTTLLAQRGARLVLLARDTESLKRDHGADARCLIASADLLDEVQVQHAVAAAVRQFTRIDALCHLAGGFRMGQAVHETSAQTWNFLLDINTRTLLHTAHAVVPHMLAAGGGRIVTVGSQSAHKGMAQMGAYCAAKSAVIRLTEAMSAELREHHINVNCVLPSVIDTPENRAAMPEADPGRWVAPLALAEVIAFLVSDAASAIHGAALPVTGLS